MLTTVFSTVLPWLLIAIGAWLGYQLVRQNGRILLRLESIERRIAGRNQSQPQSPPSRWEPEGLPIGSAAPEFELPDLAGNRRKLSDFRGRDLLLVFFGPKCGFCTQMAADLAALPCDGEEGRPIPLVITNGNADENRKLVEEYGIRCTVLLQEEMQVASQYRAQGTPMGYRIDAEGKIASGLAVGGPALLELAVGGAPPAGSSAERPAANGRDGYHSLSRSRLKRDGLEAGTAAPEFTLPCIDGGDLSLSDYRGRRVLLVFSDPECGPCDALAPRLQELHESRSDLQVLVVSRQELEKNRAKADALGLTFPIVLQKRWEVSLKYAMFATPIGYLIDEEGILLSDVAVGVEPILALADGTAADLSPRSEAILNGSGACC
jgi:peroxiredoxin